MTPPKLILVKFDREVGISIESVLDHSRVHWTPTAREAAAWLARHGYHWLSATQGIWSRES